MQGICRTCGQAFELGTLRFGKDSGVKEEKGDEPIRLIPIHDPVPGKAKSGTCDLVTGELVEEFCHGSLRSPTETIVH